jgi:small subunit ribosomal protein S1
MAEPRDKSESFAALFEQSAGATARQRRFKPGERLDVTVVALGRDAVFADLGAKQEGYFDLPELCGRDGKLSVAVGAKIAAVVTSVDDGSGQVRLSPVFVRKTNEDSDFRGGDNETDVVIPIAKSAPLLIEGARVRGKVTGIERYGLFVQIGGTQGRGGRGLVPTQETGTPRGADLKKHFTVGQDIETKILNIAEDGKIRLSIAAIKADEERGEFESFAQGERTQSTQKGQKGGDAGQAAPVRGFGTLGDLLSKGASNAGQEPRPAAKGAANTSPRPAAKDAPKKRVKP